MSQDPVRRSIESIFSHPANLLWFCGANSIVSLDAIKATEHFLARAQTTDISPTYFFDPAWFRANYRVDGANAFLSYLRNPSQQFARPSPVFAPRWYSRRYHVPMSVNPLVDFLTRGDARDPHPLIDVAFLKTQSSRWTDGATALEFLLDPQRFPLLPHPLFDARWYLERNPDVAAAGLNPLAHYLRFGHQEGRAPNRSFSLQWYRQMFIDRHKWSRVEPLTHYVTTGYKTLPAPGLKALRKPMIVMTQHGPAPYVESVRHHRSPYAALRHRPDVDPGVFTEYMSGRVQDYNPLFPDHTVLLRNTRVALMMTPKCASARIVYWWLEQAGLLETAQRFSVWSHAFEQNFRQSREYLDDALTFDPDRYTTYKFVRHPLARAASGFTRILRNPEHYGLPSGQTHLSFMEFLEQLRTSNFMNDDHFKPQFTQLEANGSIRPRVLRIEDGLNAHFRLLEATHGLPEATFESDPEIKRQLRGHTHQGRASMSAGPHKPIPLRTIPDYAALMTSEARRKVRELYAVDFAAYGYADELPAGLGRAPATDFQAAKPSDLSDQPLQEAAE